MCAGKELSMGLAHEPVRILCVDDERNVLRALERIFLDDDYEIVIAGSGDEGLNIMEESGPFQVVISDYRMPVMNGVEFLREVYERWPETVRIVLSGYADAGSIVAAINEGHIYKFIPKPWNDEELRVTIQNCLERYFLLKRNRELLAELAAANQALEEKVLHRTEQLELRNRALEFSQGILGKLPVGVVGIDNSGMIALCNTKGMSILSGICKTILGGDVNHNCSAEFSALVGRIREEKKLDTTIQLNDKSWRVMGTMATINESEAAVAVFLEV